MSLGDSSYVSVLSSCVISWGTCSGSSFLFVTLLEPLKHVISVCGYRFIDDHTTGPKLSIDTNGQDTGEDFPLSKNCPTLKITLRIALYFQGSEILICLPSHTPRVNNTCAFKDSACPWCEVVNSKAWSWDDQTTIFNVMVVLESWWLFMVEKSIFSLEFSTDRVSNRRTRLWSLTARQVPK